VPGLIRRVGRRIKRLLGLGPVSTDYQLLPGPLPAGTLDGWCNPDVPKRQWQAFEPLLTDMRLGAYRQDFVALGEAVHCTELVNPLIVEIGCGSGWNSEVLDSVLRQPLRYIGGDYSLGMVQLGKAHYASVPFLVCDALSLPFGDASCDILLSGGVLLHLAEYRKAIEESRRVARRFVVFHTVPVHFKKDTTFLKKRAYGEWVVEVVFNEKQLTHVFHESGLRVRRAIENIPYDLIHITGEHSTTKTYVCEVVA